MTWELMGFEDFSLALYENPELIKALNQRIGDLILSMFEFLLKMKELMPSGTAMISLLVADFSCRRRCWISIFPLVKKDWRSGQSLQQAVGLP